MLTQYFEFKPGIPVKLIEDYLYPNHNHRLKIPYNLNSSNIGICKLCHFKGVTENLCIKQINKHIELCIYCVRDSYIITLLDYWFPPTIYQNKKIDLFIKNKSVVGRIKYLIRRNNSYYYCIHYIINFKKYLCYIKYDY